MISKIDCVDFLRRPLDFALHFCSYKVEKNDSQLIS